MSRDKQIEIHELAKRMSEAISTEVDQRYIADEAKLEAVLRANGWVKAEEIFAEIDQYVIRGITVAGEHLTLFNCKNYSELKKKYTQGKEKIPPYVRMDAKALPAILNVKYTESEKDDG